MIASRAVSRRCLALAAAVLGAACSGPPDLGPPEVRYGEDACHECRMIVSDERYAAALVVRDEGRVVKRVFDDVGCLVRHRRGLDASDVAGAFVASYATREWLPFDGATYVASESLHSPMGYGLAAVGSRGEAERLAEDTGARIVEAAALAAEVEKGGPSGRRAGEASR